MTRPFQRAERGMSEAIQWAVLAPVVMAALLGVIEAGVWLHARTVVQQAALTAAETQALHGVSPGAAEQVVAQMTSELLDVRTTNAVGADAISVTVRARVPLALDLGLTEVSATASRPRER